jgi:hypothetical protein
MREKIRMLKLTMYGLVGLAAMLIVAFYFAWRDEFLSLHEKLSHDLPVHGNRGQAEASRG